MKQKKTEKPDEFTRLNPLNDFLFKLYICMGTEECKSCLISFLNAGQDYITLKKTISINILGYNVAEFRDYEEFHTRFHFRSKEHPFKITSHCTRNLV